jgi:hypothetical protein
MSLAHRSTGPFYTLLGWMMSFCTVGYYLCWILPRTGWLHYTGRITPRDDRYWTETDQEGKF